MATVIGQSGAYQQVLKELASVGLSVGSISQVAALRDSCATRRGDIEQEALVEFTRIEQECMAAVSQWERQVGEVLAARMPKFEQQEREAEEQVHKCERDREAVGSMVRNLWPPARLRVWFRVWRRLRVARRHSKAVRVEQAQFRSSLEAPLHQSRANLDRHRRDRERFIATRLTAVEDQIVCLERITKEGGLAGAAAEIEVIDALAKLPEGWFVLNNVNLRAHDWIHFNGAYLRTAQLDHVVVGPGGLFVIETKNWSRQFADGQEYFDPFQQIARSSYLCYRMLKDAGIARKTRSVIATKGRLPDRPQDSYTKILRPDELCRYVTWFKPELDRAEVERAVASLQRVGHLGEL